MEKKWHDKVVLITGGTSGIGKACVDKFDELGAIVHFCGRRESLGQEICQSLSDRATFAQVDVESEDSIQNFIQTAHAKHGKIDVLFNNAGGPAKAGDLQDMSAAECDQAYRLLFRSVFLGLKYVAPLMKAAGRGSIISNASVAAHLGGYSTSHLYSAMKSAVMHLSKSVALELADYGVRVNTVSPGAISTGIFARGAGIEGSDADATSDKVANMLKRAQPLARAGLPEDIANAVLFLASDEAGFITGRDLVIDGGLISGRRHKDVQAGKDAMAKALSGS